PDNPSLLTEVKSLLAVHDHTPFSGLQKPAWNYHLKFPDQSPGAADLEPDPDLPFDQLGEYRLIRRLGRGGMGVVYLAVQEPLGRQVALKVIRPEKKGSFEIESRFYREAEAISKLNHPGIVTVYGSGEEQGVRYYAMELLRGAGLNELLQDAASRSERIPMQKVVGWIREIAEALATAHEAGIIHRDVKPSNIHITADGKVMLMDFGIARNMDLSTLTLTGEFRGTPHYASPEQIRAGRDEIDERTDIYSLGVTFYRAVTGRIPFEGETTEQVFHQILEVEPVPPRRLNPYISREAETIIATAMEKDKKRRYQNMAAFAEDLRRLQGGETILAKPAGMGIKLLKRIQRYPALSAAMISIVLLIAVIPWIFVVKEREQREAAEAANIMIQKQRNEAIASKKEAESQRAQVEIEKRKAEEEAETAEAVLDFVVGLFRSSDPAEARGAEITAREILDRSAEKAENMFIDQPVVRGRLLFVMGKIYGLLGRFSDAAPLLEDSVEIRRRALGTDHPDTLISIDALSLLYKDQGQYERSEQLCREVLEKRRQVLGEDHPDVLNSMNNLACLLLVQGRYEKAEAIYLEVLEKRKKAPWDDHPAMIESLNNLAVLYGRQGRLVEAEPLFIDALEINRRLKGDDHPNTIESINNLAILYDGQGRFKEAESLYIKALEKSRHILGDDHPITIGFLHNMAFLYEKQGCYEKAEPLLLEVIERSKGTLGDDHPDTLSSLNNLGNVYKAQGRLDEAESIYKEGLEKRRQVLPEDHPDIYSSMNNLALTYQAQGRYEEAKPLFLEALEKRTRILGKDHPYVLDSLNNLAGFFFCQKKYEEAEPYALEHYSRTKVKYGDSHPNTLKVIDLLILIYDKWGKTKEVEKYSALVPSMERTSQIEE
ncbi:MAG: tetratricopeptide repeat protein, partial [Planctomycetes bacterium]|nr:tetratricopeptide repeat protein [Planctomycetota bacterium]